MFWSGCIRCGAMRRPLTSRTMHRKSARTRIKRLISQLESVPPGRIESEVKEGVPFREIVETASFEKCGLIVINLQSKTALERAFVGSTAERVVRTATVPVLNVPLVGARVAIEQPVQTGTSLVSV